jgi:hypothetical protein
VARNSTAQQNGIEDDDDDDDDCVIVAEKGEVLASFHFIRGIANLIL